MFHGTPNDNIDSICKNGLNPALRKRQNYGPGEYFTADTKLALNFTDMTSKTLHAIFSNGACPPIKLVVFAVLMDKKGLTHRSKDLSVVVVHKTAHQLPIFTAEVKNESMTPELMLRQAIPRFIRHWVPMEDQMLRTKVMCDVLRTGSMHDFIIEFVPASATYDDRMRIKALLQRLQLGFSAAHSMRTPKILNLSDLCIQTDAKREAGASSYSGQVCTRKRKRDGVDVPLVGTEVVRVEKYVRIPFPRNVARGSRARVPVKRDDGSVVEVEFVVPLATSSNILIRLPPDA